MKENLTIPAPLRIDRVHLAAAGAFDTRIWANKSHTASCAELDGVGIPCKASGAPERDIRRRGDTGCLSGLLYVRLHLRGCGRYGRRFSKRWLVQHMHHRRIRCSRVFWFFRDGWLRRRSVLKPLNQTCVDVVNSSCD